MTSLDDWLSFVCPGRLSGQQEVEDPCASDDEGYTDYADSEPTIG